MAYWLKVVGSREDPHIHDDPRPRDESYRRRLGDVQSFPQGKRPSGIKKGDTLIIYAAGSGHHFGEGRVYAVEEVLSEEPERGGHDRWEWTLRTHRHAVCPSLARAPTLSDIGVNSKSVRQQSHIRLSDDQGKRAEALMRAGHAAE